jgi:small subunit ribosomal protein S1
MPWALAKDEEKKVAARKAAPKKDATPAIQNVAASTTLGDLDALAELKAKLEKGE